LAQPVSAAELVLFIDCARDGQPGDLHCDELVPQPGSASLTHHLTPGVLLGLSSELYGACPRSYVLTICGQSFEPGDVLSPAVDRSLGAVKSRVQGLSEEWLAASVGPH
jgi:hypothetical protein